MNKKRQYAFPSFLTGEDVKQIREWLGLTQQGLAELMSVSKKTVEHWEREQGQVKGAAAVLLTLLWERPALASQFVVPPATASLRLWYMYRWFPCTVMDVEERMRQVTIYNFTDHLQFRAFGSNDRPSYEDYEAFLASRCFPESRDKMKLQLRELNLPFYDPFMIIQKTQGRMAEDDFWIRIEHGADGQDRRGML